MTENVRNGQLGPDRSQHRLRLGLLVVDRIGATVGRIRHLHRPDPLAVADDGRRIGDASDIAAMLPGWSVHTLPRLPGPVAARLVREGYVEIVGGPRSRDRRYAALTDVVAVTEEACHLAVGVDELPAEAKGGR